jgi:hypothetical protein
MAPSNKSDFDRIYEGATVVFLNDEHEHALHRFLSIYEVDCTFRDVAEIVNDYWDMQKPEWVAKYHSRFKSPHENV